MYVDGACCPPLIRTTNGQIENEFGATLASVVSQWALQVYILPSYWSVVFTEMSALL